MEISTFGASLLLTLFEKEEFFLEGSTNLILSPSTNSEIT
jgi:hypothetical protein